MLMRRLHRGARLRDDPRSKAVERPTISRSAGFHASQPLGPLHEEAKCHDNGEYNHDQFNPMRGCHLSCTSAQITHRRSDMTPHRLPQQAFTEVEVGRKAATVADAISVSSGAPKPSSRP